MNLHKIFKLLVLQAAFACTLASAADPAVVLGANGAGAIVGTLPAGKTSTWKVAIQSGKKARFHLVKGKGEISLDVHDSHGTAANEGVSDGDWFPVEPGEYKATLVNVTNLNKSKSAHDVPFEVKFEVR
jgi:hypothetical protein